MNGDLLRVADTYERLADETHSGDMEEDDTYGARLRREATLVREAVAEFDRIMAELAGECSGTSCAGCEAARYVDMVRRCFVSG